MRIAAGMLVKDERDVIQRTVANLLDQGVDRIYVLDNMSTDGTAEVLHALAEATRRVTVTLDLEVGYRQSQKMTEMLLRAVIDGYEWLVPCDADELWSGVDGRTIRDVLAATPQTAGVVTAALYDYLPTDLDDPHVEDPMARITWRQPLASGLPKVAVRCRAGVTIEQGNHGAHATPELHAADGLMIRHYPYRTPQQFVRKVRNGSAAYHAYRERNPAHGVHWIAYGDLLARGGENALVEHYETHFHHAQPEGTLVRDPAPAWA